jgi:UDP-3-O-[3-hydroxymyristoyl] N-acetylglucosamine deacetylase
MAADGFQSGAFQHTVKTPALFAGVGVHTGAYTQVAVRAGGVDAGVVFVRTDVTDRDNRVPVSPEAVCKTQLGTVIGNQAGVTVATIEHLMAALVMSGVDNAVVELDGPEVPIMDGSAAPFVQLIERAGTVAQDAARRALKILKPVSVSDNGSSAALLPEHGFSMSFEIDFDNPLIRRQDINLNFETDTFKAELAPARTFGLLDDWPRLKAAGLARGGSLDNAVVVSGNRVLNDGGLRFSDEFVRHKLVDALGDLYLAGGPIIGHFRGLRSGHALTRRLIAALFADRDAWCDTTIAEATALGAVSWPHATRVARA